MTNTILWKKIKEWLISSDLIEPNVYEEYIKNAFLEDLSNNQKAIIVNTELSKWYLESIHSDIKEKMSNFVEKDIDILFLTSDEFKKEKKIKDIITKKNKTNISQDYLFDNFISGSSNINALNASIGIAENLGTKWNPLFIYGDSGLGKTHLLKAISNKVNNSNLALNVKYYTSLDFRKEILESLMDGFKEIESTKEKMNSIDVLLIDDIQFLANSGKTNEIFFNLFNSFIENNKQIVLTSDKFPEHLNGFDKRLISRFSQGLSVKIESPDLQTAINIIEYKIKIANIFLSPESIKYIASYFGTDVRKLEGIINKIEFYIIQDKQESTNRIELDKILKILEDYSFAPSGEVTIQKIKSVVALNYGINIKAIDSNLRLQNVVKARHVAMYLTGEILKKNYSEIGIAFGGKDHTTVINAYNKINKFLKEDKLFKNTLKKIKKEIIS
ncbi:chromosomal replication initiator protein DnaA [Spiroplasma taiwanense]|uniref:Chromosomal replication initiator protein DnaA n=1 Tax=Spiroplasma taiwanense CT-1 TaxID=1276220 RepID=S5MAC6_9MOLU|nr:chromosomal replication initiator protein DnaA [Spiroplasma taiwanense]AGR40698.1 chromosomal replication initiation protein [Spiroplasma taiwanense CT-1]